MSPFIKKKRAIICLILLVIFSVCSSKQKCSTLITMAHSLHNVIIRALLEFFCEVTFIHFEDAFIHSNLQLGNT